MLVYNMLTVGCEMSTAGSAFIHLPSGGLCCCPRHRQRGPVAVGHSEKPLAAVLVRWQGLAAQCFLSHVWACGCAARSSFSRLVRQRNRNVRFSQLVGRDTSGARAWLHCECETNLASKKYNTPAQKKNSPPQHWRYHLSGGRVGSCG